jgi:glycosyltransferase involved in cell wall biosynthesis
MRLSVIICTHNPREDYLRRTLEALEKQTLPKEGWELLLIDNASAEPLAGKWDLSWHPHSRHIRENELGKTPALLRGIKEASGDLLVVVDDDNVLSPNYLSIASELMASHPWIGAAGGNIAGEFETKPEPWAEAMFPSLAIVRVNHEEWACGAGSSARGFAPVGAGSITRRNIATYYAEVSANDPLRRGLDRKGASLSSGGDTDMALCACALGFAIGRFPELQMTHLISAARLQRSYLLRLAEGLAFSDAVLRYIWDGDLPRLHQETPCRSERIFQMYLSLRKRLAARKTPDFMTEVNEAAHRGISRAYEILLPDSLRKGQRQ